MQQEESFALDKQSRQQETPRQVLQIGGTTAKAHVVENVGSEFSDGPQLKRF